MATKVGFIGNCQMETLSRIYSRLLGDDSDTAIFYIPSYEPAEQKQRNLVGNADIIVRQIMDFDQKIGHLDTNAAVYLFPHVSGAFLWPNGGEAHPLNKRFPYFDPSGPYPPELGDSFLNRMLKEEVDPQIAVVRYLALDIAAEKNLARLKDLVLDRQRARDRACGYEFADIIETRFRTERLFRSPNHPEVGLTMLMASQLFERLGVDAERFAQAAAMPAEDLFPKSETPIHPGVVEKFGLTFADKDHRYRYFDEGAYTFEEYAGRYMRFDWDKTLAEGMHWFRAKQPVRALGILERAVVSSPRSAIARHILSDLLVKQVRIAEGVQHAKDAVALEPANPDYRERYEYFSSILPPPPEEPEPMIGAHLEIEFGRAGNAYKYQGEGWSLTERDYTWTAGHRASLRIGMASLNSGYILTFTAAPFAPRCRPFQRCSILLNGIWVGEFCLEKSEENSIWIPSDLIAEVSGKLIITFELPDAARPVDFEGEIPDQRMLGLAFQRISLDRLHAA